VSAKGCILVNGDQQAMSTPSPTIRCHSFFFFSMKKLFHLMAIESNRYANDSVPERARNIRVKQLKEFEQKKRQKEAVETRKKIRTRLRNSFVPFTPTEYVRLFGLIIGRMLCPQKRRLSTHRNMTPTGCVPAGTFSAYMSKNRYGNRTLWLIVIL
jgi:hypothetical protein